jgi:hypothetical protein
MGSTSSKIPPAKSKRAGSQQDFKSDDSNSAPPPYTGVQGNPIQNGPVRIKSSDIPQWAWTNEQCRQWITLMLEKGGKEHGEAERLAENFQGFGPNLWLNTYKTYCDWFGAANGQAIYALLLGVRGEKGAVPKTVAIRHYKQQSKDES